MKTLRTGISYGDTLVWMSNQQLAAALDDARAVNASWVRVDLSWNNIQNDGPQWYDWQGFDRVVTAARARGLSVLPTLAYTPPWARVKNCPDDKCAPATPDLFASFASAAARRYAPLGVHTWEIWNEQNSISFWKPAPSPQAYTNLLRQTRQAIRQVDPSATLLMGGLASMNTDGSNVSQSDFLASASALGANRLVDAVAYHPYTYPFLASSRTTFGTSWERMTQGRSNLRSVLTAYGTPNLPIWITEYGSPTGGPGTASNGNLSTIGPNTTHVTEDYQARMATDAVRTAAADPYVASLFWYAQRDLSTDRSSNENFYGLRRADGSPKPAFQTLTGALSSTCHSGTTICR